LLVTINFLCPLCYSSAEAARGLLGRRARCPFCHEIVDIAEPSGAASAQTDEWDEDSATAAAIAGFVDTQAVEVETTPGVSHEELSALDTSGSISGFQPVEITDMKPVEQNPFLQPLDYPARRRPDSLRTDEPNPFAGNPFTLAPARRGGGGGDDDFVYDLSDDDDDTPGDDDGAVQLGTGHEREEGDMDMTPMVDVTFLLLIFFMVTAAFSLQRSLPLPVPEQQDEPSTEVKNIEDVEQDPNSIVVLIDPFNTYTVITPDAENEAPSKQDLLIRLREAKSSGTTVPKTLLVVADLEALHGRVVDALDAGTAVGMENIQLMPSDEEAK